MFDYNCLADDVSHTRYSRELSCLFCCMSIIVRDGGHVAVVVILQYVRCMVLPAALDVWQVSLGGLAFFSVSLSVYDSILIGLSRRPAAPLLTPGPRNGGSWRV